MPNTEDDVAPPPRRGRPRDPERVRRIIEAAHSHFNAHGLERASVDAIAAEAGVSKMTIYSHFASKEGLFEAVIRDRTDRVMGGVAGVYPKVMVNGEMDAGAWSCGMVVGLIDDIPSVKDLIDRIMADAYRIIRSRLAERAAAASSEKPRHVVFA